MPNKYACYSNPTKRSSPLCLRTRVLPGPQQLYWLSIPTDVILIVKNQLPKTLLSSLAIKLPRMRRLVASRGPSHLLIARLSLIAAKKSYLDQPHPSGLLFQAVLSSPNFSHHEPAEHSQQQSNTQRLRQQPWGGPQNGLIGLPWMVPSLVLEGWPSQRQRGRADLRRGKRAVKPGSSLEVLLSRRLTRGVLAHAEHLHRHLPVARAHQEPQHKAEGDFGTPLPRPWQSFRWQSRSRHEASGAPCLQAAVQIPSRISLISFFPGIQPFER